MSKKSKTQQKSKLARANNKLSKILDRYYGLNFDMSMIRKELKISDSIFDNKNPLEAKFRLNFALSCRAVNYEIFQTKNPNFSKWLNEPKTFDDQQYESFQLKNCKVCNNEVSD